MKIVDVNVLVYTVNRDMTHHSRVRRWWELALNAREPIGLAWVVILGFLRLAVNPHVFSNPLSHGDAIEVVDAWLKHSNVRIVIETNEHWRTIHTLLEQSGSAGNRTTDAHLAAISITHGATLVSCDNDFARFSRLRWENPLTILS